MEGTLVRKLFSVRSKQLDLTAQKILYEQFYNVVYRTAYRFCGDELAAQDIVQETFIRAFRYISSYKETESGSFEGWIATIAKNESLKYLKSSWKSNEIILEEVSTYSESSDQEDSLSVDQHVLMKLEVEELIRLIDQLTIRYRQIIQLRLFHEYSFKEIGELLDIQENAARQIYHRAKKELQHMIQQLGGVLDEE